MRTACWMRAREVAGRSWPVACHAAAARLQTLQPPAFSMESMHRPIYHGSFIMTAKISQRAGAHRC